ncbi:MAG: clostripain-related cysteine peptidase [Euryarchaeota archaeon]|nr:clostripain-related cysteine peptidase [Euryarchaeota archaeon]
MKIKKGVLTLICFSLLVINVPLTTSDVTGNISEKKWTVMYYFGGDQEWDWQSVNQLIDIFLNATITLSPHINLVILGDWTRNFYAYAQITKLRRAKFVVEDIAEINTGNYTTLRDYVLRCKTEYPAERYYLHIHGHGHAWYGACPDCKTNDTENPNDMLTMNEIHKALDESGGVDILEFTNCRMGNLEAAYELRNCTKVYIGSEDEVTTAAPFSLMLGELRVLRDNYYKSNIKIAEIFIKKLRVPYTYTFTPSYLIMGLIYALKYHYFTSISGLIYNKFTMSAIRTDALDDVSTAIDDLAHLLVANREDYQILVTNVRSQADDFPPVYNPDNYKGAFVDVYNFADVLNTLAFKASKQELYRTTRNIKRSMEKAVIAEWHQVGHKQAQGLTLYFPFNNSDIYPWSGSWNLHNYTTFNLEFTANTYWDEFLTAYLT